MRKSKYTQEFKDSSILPSYNIANWEIVKNQFQIGIVHSLDAF